MGAGTERQRSGRQSHVAHVERQTEEAPDAWGHSEHEAKHNGAAPGCDVARERLGETRERFGFQGGAEAMLRNCPGQPMVDGPVFDPAARETREPENHARQGGEKGGAAPQGMHCFYGILGGLQVKEGMADEPPPQNAENDRTGAYGKNIAESGGELGTDNALDVNKELITIRRDLVPLNDTGKRSTGHGGLLGGERQVVILHDDEADGIVQAREETFDERR